VLLLFFLRTVDERPRFYTDDDHCNENIDNFAIQVEDERDGEFLVDNGEEEGCDDHTHPIDDVDERNDDLEFGQSFEVPYIHTALIEKYFTIN
jgi:hypothetical protein